MTAAWFQMECNLCVTATSCYTLSMQKVHHTTVRCSFKSYEPDLDVLTLQVR